MPQNGGCLSGAGKPLTRGQETGQKCPKIVRVVLLVGVAEKALIWAEIKYKKVVYSGFREAPNSTFLNLKKMKANFRLDKNNYGEFLKRLNRMMAITGSLVFRSEYTGAKKIHTMLRGYCVSLLTPTVVKTIPHYLNKGYEFDSYPSNGVIKDGEGLILGFNTDSCIVFYWGQRFHFSPNKIVAIGDVYYPERVKYKSSFFRDRLGARLEILVNPNYEMAVQENTLADAYAKAYWQDYERECFGKDFDEAD